jgi:DNA-binding beta-propeller fold protein YncE
VTLYLIFVRGTVSVIHPIYDINEQNITVGSRPSEIVSDLRSKLYVSNSNSGTVSVIDVSGRYGILIQVRLQRGLDLC